MANISSASGTMYIDRTFYDRNKKLIDDWVKFYQTSQNHDWYGFSYIEIEKITEDELWLRFYGDGRWSWENTLERVFASDDFESQFNLYKTELTKRLYEDKQSILMEYKDYEPGCEILVEREATLNVEKYKGKYYTEVTVDTDIDIKYNDYNRVATGVEEGYRLDNEKECKSLLEYLKDFYYKNKDMVSESDYRAFKKDVLTYIKDDNELKGGICLFRLEDPGMFLDNLETSLEIV
ncbi:hypothetical protein [Ligilactobacillus salivarius]|uniref:hypothetical protein n=1 Tax=Ligilactobacillus salivarius TaxID=1624 RepID=UPI002967480B|nr:hypothetical protein [Ligilactobacillus salivarius]MDW3022876.1 hypothetical protein [Ligilactobacillus salivarius]